MRSFDPLNSTRVSDTPRTRRGRLSNQGPPPPIVDRIGEIAPRPVFLIYADRGNGVGENTMQPGYYAAAGEPKQIWRVPGAEHTGGLDAQPVEYERRVTTFFDDALLEK